MLKTLLAAAAALVPAATLFAQAVAPAPDYSTATVTPGVWGYQTVPGGSHARLVDATGTAQLMIQCSKATRRISISRASGTPGQGLFVWASSMSRTLPARYDANGRWVTADLAATDPLLDAIAYSRGRFVVNIVGGTSLVAPSWPEPARVFEDCRI